MSSNIYIVRHAEVENPNGIEYMRLPGFGLSALGTEQAEQLAKIFQHKDISIIYSSPLQRTKETAKIISAGKIKIKYSRNLLEANYTKWQGINRDDRRKEDISAYLKNPVKHSIVLGESLVDIQKRTLHDIFGAAEKYPNQNIIFVTHAAPLITAKLFFENKSLMEFQNTIVNYGSVTTIAFDDELNCKGVRYNEYVEQRKAENE